jgi:ATP-dependent DNA helicase RecG
VGFSWGCKKVITLLFTTTGLKYFHRGGVKDFSLEDAMNGFSKLRNNALGDALEYMKEVEAWGGGVSRYFTACAESGLPPPIVVEEAGFFKVVFWRQTKGAGTFDDASAIMAKTTVKTTAKTTAENSVQSTLSGAALSIWNLICKNPATSISALATATSLTCDGVRYHIRRLTSQGRLKRIGGTKGGRWEVNSDNQAIGGFEYTA